LRGASDGFEEGVPGESYNIGGLCEKKNLELVHFICDFLDERLGLLNGKARRTLIRSLRTGRAMTGDTPWMRRRS